MSYKSMNDGKPGVSRYFHCPDNIFSLFALETCMLNGWKFSRVTMLQTSSSMPQKVSLVGRVHCGVKFVGPGLSEVPSLVQIVASSRIWVRGTFEELRMHLRIRLRRKRLIRIMIKGTALILISTMAVDQHIPTECIFRIF
jgi:hypothetical protein